MFSLYVRFNICKHQPFFIFIGLAPLCNCTNVGSIQHQVCTSILFIKSKLHCSRFAALCNFWIFKREYNSKHDRFAVAGKTLLKDCIEPITVLHVLRELSQRTWYATQEGAQFEATIHNAKARPSPLLEGWLEIPITVKVVWPLVEKLSIYITKAEEIKYPVTGKYVDDSKEILKELVGTEAVDSIDDAENEELADTKDENFQDNEIIEKFILRISFLVDLVQ